MAPTGTVEPEDRRPAPALDEDAAEHRTEGRGGGTERPEQAGREPLSAGRERVEQEHQRSGDHGRRADRLHDAEGDELVDRAGTCARIRGDGEQRETENEETLVAVAVGQPAHREEQDGEHEVIAVHHPGDRDDGGFQAADDQRNGDAHRCGVGEGQDDPGKQRRHDQPGPRLAGRGSTVGETLSSERVMPVMGGVYTSSGPPVGAASHRAAAHRPG